MLNARMMRAALVLSALLTCRMNASVGVLKGDTYISSASAATNFEASPLINIGAGNTGLLQFDFSPAVSRMLTGVTPATVSPIIGKATLTVYVNKAAAAGTLSAAPLLGAWVENSVTGATLPSVGPTAGSVPVTASGQFVTIDVTTLVQGWLSEIMIRLRRIMLGAAISASP